MSFMASLCWGAITALTALPNDGSILSMCSWLALHSIYIAKHCRGLRNRNQYLFTSLLGGLAVTSMTTMFAMLAWKDASRGLSTSMGEFALQALTVGPAVTTMWNWVISFVMRKIEQQPCIGLPAETPEGIQLGAIPTGHGPEGAGDDF